MIESTKSDAELYEAERLRDEQRGPGVKSNSYLGREISKGVGKPIVSHDDLMGRVG